MFDGSRDRPTGTPGAAADRAALGGAAGHRSGESEVTFPANLRRRRRSAWNPSRWTPGTSSFMPVAAPMSPGARTFAPTEHLASEAVAAFVDGELAASAQMRATQHLAMCPECDAAVDAQTAARSRLRESGQIAMPSGLLGQLSQIPTREIDLNDMAAVRGQGAGAQQPHQSRDRQPREQQPQDQHQGSRQRSRQVPHPAPGLPGAAPFPSSSVSRDPQNRNPLNRWRGR